MIPQRANTTRLQNEGSLGQRFSYPAHGKSSQDMTMSHDQNVAFLVVIIWVLETMLVVLRSNFGDECVEATADVIRGSGCR